MHSCHEASFLYPVLKKVDIYRGILKGPKCSKPQIALHPVNAKLLHPQNAAHADASPAFIRNNVSFRLF